MISHKFGELMLYIASQSLADRAFGATKLNKIMFAIDFSAFGLWGHSVTDADYVRLEHGPAPQGLPEVRDELVAEGRAAIQTREYYGKIQQRLVALTDPDMSIFTEKERRLIDDVIDALKSLNATQLSDWTHAMAPWLSAKENETIPYYTVFTMLETPKDRAGMEWAEKRLEERKASGDVP
jgi:uncharacterized phage-associated protein